MKYSFSCYGHENITARHKTTLEFTKDDEMRLEGDCIVGIGADFELASLKRFIKSLGNNRKITITIETINNTDNEKIINDKKIKINDKNNNNEKNIKNEIIGKITAEINPDFNSDKEMVIRKSDFVSARTFAIKADKAAFELGKGLVGFLTEKGNKIRIVVEIQKGIDF